jgi:hypothetical protein
MEFFLRAFLIGVGATALMDVYAFVARRFFGVAFTSWAMVGRWVGHLAKGRLAHPGIAKASPVRGELAVGWIFHYVVGIALAALLLSVVGVEWARRPTAVPALAFGVLTVVFPFFVMQPGMGAGVAASKTASPGRSRARSLVTHAVFGAGLYVSAWLAAGLEAG